MEHSDKKRVKDFLARNLKISSDKFENLDEEIEIQNDRDINEKIHAISKKCHDMSDRSLEILSKQAGEEKLEDIENCAMALSDVRGWLEVCIKNKDLSLEIEDISNYVKSLEEMADKMEFIDSIESHSADTHKNLRKIMVKRFEENK
ncbi:MAG TPA: hypothetical protein PLI06_09985 [Methanofastidiosum sp.]|nr:hypothetical protein [Methanofastidiosum sp.]